MTAAPQISDIVSPQYRARSGFAFQTLPLIAVDALAAFVAAAITVLGRYFLGGEFHLTFYLGSASVIVLFIAVYAILGLYRTVMLHPVIELKEIVRGTTFTVLLLGTLTFFQRDAEAYSRAVLLVSWIVIIAFVWIGRVALRSYLGSAEWWGEPAVLLGAGPAGRSAVEALRRHSTGLKIVAVLDDHPANLEAVQGIAPFTANLNKAPLLADSFGIRYAILAMPHLRNEELSAMVESYASRYRHVLIIPDLMGISSLGVDAMDIGGVLAIEVSHRLLHRASRRIKRSFDLAAALIILLALSPFMALAYILVRLNSRGPAFYGQTRIGQGGKEFIAWKFRTMLRDSESLLHECLAADPALAEEWVRDHKLRNDPRVTSVGRILRRTSLDELPQVWNVLRGEMSLVGPRPIVSAEINRYGPKYELYAKVRSGLTGLWQVSGRNNTTYEQRVQLDEYYVRNWSIWLDLYILARTIKVVVTGEGAY